VIIEVIVKTSSKESSIKREGDIYYISLKSKPFHNSANIELIDSLSSYFNTLKSSIVILKGFKSKKKLIEIMGI
jgi:uncharacterized protein YggU (UPF0235/DUF167 family)